MKRLQWLLLAATVLACGSAAFANSNADPRIVIKDPVCPSHCTAVGTQFTFTSPKSGSGVLFFNNNSGVSWFSLKLIETGVPSSAITCSAPGAFAHCLVSTVNGVTTILLTGIGNGFTGIPSGHNFSIHFQGWPEGGVDFRAIANVPEPATVALFLTGLGFIERRRRKLVH